MLNEDNLISTLEQSLRQFQAAEQRLQERLRKIEDEAKDLKIEIEALQNSAEKTEEALESLFSTMRSGTKSWKTHRKINHEDDSDYLKKARYDDENDGYPKKSRYDDDDDYQMPSDQRRYSRPPVNNQPPPNGNYRKNSVTYLNNSNLNNSKNVAPITRNFEPKNNRFVDRTITQACTLLLRDASAPLHVNELYNLLREGGFEFKGNNPTISIAVSLNRNRRFCKVAPGTFDLVMRDASQVAS